MYYYLESLTFFNTLKNILTLLIVLFALAFHMIAVLCALMILMMGMFLVVLIDMWVRTVSKS